jgi:hypothetical protein
LGEPQQQHAPPDAMYYEARAEGSQVMPWGDTLSRATGGRAPQVRVRVRVRVTVRVRVRASVRVSS